MILRRVIEHVKHQNWTAVALDFFIVVMGVFIGLQVQEWAVAREHAAQHQRYYERLQADFTAISERIDSHLATFERILIGADYILEAVGAPDQSTAPVEIDEPRFTSALAIMTEQRIPPGRSATYAEMISAGQLSSLRNDELRDRLAEYDRMTEINLEVFRATQMNNSSQTPIVYRHFKVVTVPDSSMLSGIKNQVQRYDIDAMRADPEFETAVMILRQNTQNNLGVRVRESELAEEIIRLLNEETR